MPKHTWSFPQTEHCSAQPCGTLRPGPCEYHLAFQCCRGAYCICPVNSKTAPPASTYDDLGKPYSSLVRMVGCSEGPSSFECLQKVPYEVRTSFIVGTPQEVLNVLLRPCSTHLTR